jgi:hypothetical protein
MQVRIEPAMSPDAFIEDAIAAGHQNGIANLDPDQRLVYLISEAEILCDMEGIDSFLVKYSPAWLPECASAFDAVGAVEIGARLRAVNSDTPRDAPILDELNGLISARIGYDYDAIRRVIEQRLAKRVT